MSTERVLNSAITTTLSVVQRDDAGVESAADADETPTAEIRLLGVVVREVEAGDVVHDDTGTYSFVWTPTSTGRHVVTWSFVVGGDDYEAEEKIDVVADVEGSSSSEEAEGAEEDAPAEVDIGASKVCTVSGQFYDAGGNGMKGVYVRFTPDRDTTSFLSSGIVAAEVTASSDEDGALEIVLVRGVTGILAITGVGIVKRVTVPDVATTTIAALAELGDDLLEVQRPSFYKLPRRS